MSINFASTTNELIALKKSHDQKNDIEIDLEKIFYQIEKPAVKVQRQRIQIKEQEFIKLCRLAKRHTLYQPSLLKLQGPIYVATGTLGNYMELSNLIDRCGNPKLVNYLFLGDYAGRYDSSVECLIAYFVYKCRMPNNFFMIRGCYQSLSMAKNYNLYAEILHYFGSSNAWLEICEFFCCLPFAAIIDEKIFCVHGGLSPSLQFIDQINKIKRPIDTPQKQLICDLVWSDPSHIYANWTENDRGIGVAFGEKVIQKFVKNNNIELICRGHQVAYEGFQFIANKKLVTITSLSNYIQIYNNKSAVMMVDDKSNIIFKMIRMNITSSEKDVEDTLNFSQILSHQRQRQQRERQLEIEQQERQNHKEQLKKQQMKEKQQREARLKKKEEKKRRRKIREEMLRELEERECMLEVKTIFDANRQTLK